MKFQAFDLPSKDADMARFMPSMPQSRKRVGAKTGLESIFLSLEEISRPYEMRTISSVCVKTRVPNPLDNRNIMLLISRS